MSKHVPNYNYEKLTYNKVFIDVIFKYMYQIWKFAFHFGND